ncbi:MAG: hypothetical protein R8N23_13535 [Reichenbachiella sp.]|uniref:hypothetical protein n=1 Tax=Reichenbachiella sp. TaxID=2184521 RepID=UPI0029665C92|nr:hypothetical protein [Reichenbachiella sp.]MDW3210892.1 hypothetical protein [Reichenbachiella sp.]
MSFFESFRSEKKNLLCPSELLVENSDDYLRNYMFGLFKKKKKEKKAPQLLDINGEPLNEGDRVEVLRYELGECTLTLEGVHYYYESASGEKVSYAKMIDASTEQQKVRRIS